MNTSFVNIVLVCLDGQFSRLISKEIADKLDMFFADLKDYIEYDLLDSKEILEKCGVEYLNKREYDATQSFSRFENAVLTVDYNLFKQNRMAFGRECLIIYLKLPMKLIDENETANRLAYTAHDDYLKKQCNFEIVLKSKNKDKTLKLIISRLEEEL